MNTSGHQLSTRDVSSDGGKSVLKTAGKFGSHHMETEGFEEWNGRKRKKCPIE